MSSDDLKDATLDPGSFAERMLLKIERWNCNLHVGLSSELTPVEYRFQGGLNFTRGFDLECRVIAPKALSGKCIKVWLSPFGPDVKFGTDGLDEVGQLHICARQPEKPDFSATLLIPESASTCGCSISAPTGQASAPSPSRRTSTRTWMPGSPEIERRPLMARAAPICALQ
jgi:hypothetical protein